MQAINNEQFSTKNYWESRFQDEYSYDWLVTYKDF